MRSLIQTQVLFRPGEKRQWNWLHLSPGAARTPLRLVSSCPWLWTGPATLCCWPSPPVWSECPRLAATSTRAAWGKWCEYTCSPLFHSIVVFFSLFLAYNLSWLNVVEGPKQWPHLFLPWFLPPPVTAVVPIKLAFSLFVSSSRGGMPPVLAKSQLAYFVYFLFWEEFFFPLSKNNIYLEEKGFRTEIYLVYKYPADAVCDCRLCFIKFQNLSHSLLIIFKRWDFLWPSQLSNSIFTH